MIGATIRAGVGWLEKGRAVLRNWLVSSSSQNFLDARWVTLLIRGVPRPMRKNVALKMVWLSPHYFYAPIAVEHPRLRASRELLVREIVAPHVTPETIAIDYGCGPGYATLAVAPLVAEAIGLDISSGALEAARIVNPAPNVRYCQIGSAEFDALPRSATDVVFSFACIQHVTDEVFREILANIFALLKPGGKAILHLVVEAPGWTYESDWRSDRSLVGRVKLSHGLHCFNRSRETVQRLAEEAGFSVDELVRAGERTSVVDDIASQHIGYFSKPAVSPEASAPAP